MLFYVDRAPSALGKLERTPQGGYRAPATLAASNVMAYSADSLRAQGLNVSLSEFPRGSMVRVYLPPDVLKTAMDSLRAAPAPITNEHPARMVTPENYSQVTCGSAIDSTLEFDGTHLKCYLALQDAKLIGDIDLGTKRDVSMGYYADTLFQAGVTPGGEAYDAVRTSIVYNHVAIVPAGRAGKQVCLALDSDEIPTQEETTVKLKIKGVEVDASVAQAAIDSLEGELTAVTSERDKAKTELKTATDSLAVAVSDAAIDEKIAARDAKVKAEAEKAARLKVVTDAYPGLDLTGKSQEFIDGVYATAKAAKDADPDGLKSLKGEIKAPAPVSDAAPQMSEREKMLRRNRGEKV